MKNIRTVLSLLICIMMSITQFAFALEEADVTAGAGASGSDAAAESQKEEAASSDVKEEKPAKENEEESSKEETKAAEKADASSKEKSESAEKPKKADTKDDKSEKKTDSKPAFKDGVNLDGVKVSVSADEGTFPEGAKLSVKKVSAKEQKKVDEAVNKAREDELNVAKSYTFDVKILDKNGKEVQPADNKKASVSFKLDEVRDANLDVSVYHLAEKGKTLKAEELKTETDTDKVSAETEGFSYYTVEFTYDNFQYVLDGDSSVDLTDILKNVGLEGEVSKVEVSNDKLFSAEKNDGKWTVTAKKAFTSTEWMKVTIDGIVYEIVVTDAISEEVNSEYQMTSGDVEENKSPVITGAGVIMGPTSGSATIKNSSIEDRSSNGRKGGISGVNGSALISRIGATLNFENVNITESSKNLTLNLWANATVNFKDSTINASGVNYGTDPFILLGGNNGPGNLNISGTSSFKNTNAAIHAFVNSTAKVTGGTLTLDASEIELTGNAMMEVASGATLKLDGTSKVSGNTITIKSGGILDISDSNIYTLDNLPENVTLEANAIIKVKEYPINEVIVNNGESATIDSEGNITKNPPYGDQTKTIQGKTVKVRADKYNISETAPITVNNGGKLYFNNVNLNDKHTITINNGGKAYLKGTNTFGDETNQVSITNAGQILVDPDETSAEIKDSNLKMTGAGNITVEGNKTLTIGSSKVVPVGNQQIFVEADGTLKTDEGTDVDLSDCNVRYIVLREKAELDLKGSSFKNSPKLGVIRANGSNTINIDGSTFENNIANGGAYPQEFGGVLVVEQPSDVTIKDSTFTGNQASKNGGAIYQNGGTLNISGNSKFNDNTAMTINGGAVYFADGDKLTIDDGVSFTGNKAEKGYGGAVYSKAPIEVKAATFEDNTAKRGGGVYICNGGDSAIEGATFTNNTAIDSDNGGGAVAVGIDGSDKGADSLTVNKSTFKDNTAKDGGAIAIKDTKKFTVDDESSFEGNNAQRGGAVYINGVEDATIGKATFTKNGLREGQDYGAQDAGALFIESSAGETNVTLNGTKFEENIAYGPASSSGGAIYVRAGNGSYDFAKCNLYVNGAKFTNNTAGLYGGAMTVAHKARAYISDLNGDPTEFKENMVQFATDHAGGGLFINQGYVYMDDVAIYNNYAKSGGGGISSCTKGSAEAKVLGGAAIFDNHVGSDGADSQQDDYALVHDDVESYPDIFFETKDHLNRETGEQIREWEIWPIELYERMFNGGLHKWSAKPFDGIKIHDSIPLNSFMAKSNPTNKDISGAKVVFTENVASSVGKWTATGGAIGCNGLLEMGTGTEIKIVKVWDDERNNDGYRPDLDEKFLDNLIVKGNGEEIDIKSDPIKTEVVNIKDFDPAALANNIVNMKDPQDDYSDYDAWVIVISGLDLIDDDGNQIKYTVEEKDQEYYSLIENIGGNDTYFEMKNKHNPDLVNISITKEWDDNNNQSGKREPITVRLLADGVEIDKATAGEAEDYKVEFNGLPRFKDGKEIVYTLSEDGIDGYTTEIKEVSSEEHTITTPLKEAPAEAPEEGASADEPLDNDKIEELDQPIATPSSTSDTIDQIVVDKEFVITNKLIHEAIEIEGKKIWDDDNDKYGIRPESINVSLYADGEFVSTTDATEATGWKFKFTDLPVYKDGKEIKYTIEEEPVDGYKATYDGYDITNKCTKTKPHTDKTTHKNRTKGAGTGDGNNILAFIGLMAACAAVLAVTAVRRRKDC